MISQSRVTKSISFTSGKGGVGKSSLAANTALSMAQKGKRVLLFDGDLGMSNLEIFFQIKPSGTLIDCLNGDQSLSQVVTVVDKNIDLISTGSGIYDYQKMSLQEKKSYLDALSYFERHYDYLIIDTAPGISDGVLLLNASVDVCNVIITPDPSSFTDSYALIKLLSHKYQCKNFSITVNFARNEQDGINIFKKFYDVVSRFLPVGLDYAGCVLLDNSYRRATIHQRLILKQDPDCLLSQQIHQISENLQRSCEFSKSKTGLQIFGELSMSLA